MTSTTTVAGHLERALRSLETADITTLNSAVNRLAHRKVPRVTITTQLLRHSDRFKRVSRGVYGLRGKRAA